MGLIQIVHIGTERAQQIVQLRPVPIRLAQKDTTYGGDTRSQTPIRSVLSVATG